MAGTALNALLVLWPNSPFTFIKNSEFNDLLSKINFFIPIYDFVAIAQTWLVAIALYYLYSIYARWVKAIE